jgi:hypothetical protein
MAELVEKMERSCRCYGRQSSADLDTHDALLPRFWRNTTAWPMPTDQFHKRCFVCCQRLWWKKGILTTNACFGYKIPRLRDTISPVVAVALQAVAGLLRRLTPGFTSVAFPWSWRYHYYLVAYVYLNRSIVAHYLYSCWYQNFQQLMGMQWATFLKYISSIEGLLHCCYLLCCYCDC